MTLIQVRNTLLVLLLVAIVSVEGFFVAAEILNLREVWFSVLLAAVGLATLLTRSSAHSVRVLGILLASLAVLFSSILPEEVGASEGVIGWLAAFVWSSLTWLFPFVFLHFALVFPIPSPAVDRHAGLLGALYAVAGLLIVVDTFRLFPTGSGDILYPLVFIGAFATGMGVFVRQYHYSLTAAEKSRLHLILFGCLAGGTPYLISLVSGELLPAALFSVAGLLLPLFPLCLIWSVVGENFSEIERRLQNLLLYGVVTAGTMSTFFTCYALLALTGSESGTVLTLALILSLALAFPLRRWAKGYVALHFRAGALVQEGVVGKLARSLTPLFGVTSINKEWQPIRPNPYIVGNPVREETMFFGRKEDFRYLRSKLISQIGGCAIILSGERRTGKTSILFQILNGRLGSAFTPVFLDMQSFVVNNDHEFLAGIAERIRRSLPAETIAALSDVEAILDYAEMSKFLSSLLPTLGPDRRLLLLFDEYELIEDKVRVGRVSSAIYDYLNSLLEKHANLSYVFTGSRGLEAKPEWSALIGKAFFREITLLDRPDAEELICEPLSGSVRFPAKALDQLIRLTKGHPFYTQFLCQLLVELLNDYRMNVVSGEVVRGLRKRALESPPPQLLYQWSSWSPEEKLVLSSLATLLKSPSQAIAWQRINQMIQSLPSQHRPDLPSPEIRIQLENLRGRGLLERDQNRYRFALDLHRLWIATEHDVWHVLAELKDALPVKLV